MKPALELRIGQTLALTPQLQQAIRLLQLSRMELELEVNLALESNPLLDLEEPADEADEYEAAAGEEAGEAEAEADTAEGDVEESGELLEALEFGDARAHRAAVDDDNLESQDAEPEDLHDHLLWQLNLARMSATDRAIATAIIEATDEAGYLRESDEEICRTLAPLHAVSAAEVAAVRGLVQHFDPVGVASRSLQECLSVQLAELAADTPGLALARQLVEDHLEALARLDRERLCQLLGCPEEDFDQALALVRSLDPKPGSAYAGSDSDYVIPDAYARKLNGRWQVVLAPGSQPRLGINTYYASLVAKTRGEDAQYLRGQLQEARWLIKSLQTRAQTMLKVASAIVRAQEGFLEFGPQAMRPLVLKDVAGEIGMHESTISRVTTRKYLHTPRGTFEFKHFFCSGVGTSDGGEASALAVQEMIRRMIEDEAPGRPLSDLTISRELNKQGIHVARRTVAKYRDALKIPSSNDRSRLA